MSKSVTRILVVDDNRINAKLAAKTLQYAGYTVAIAPDAEAAQEMLQITAYELILMDIGLPGMDGLAFTRKLKADTQTKHIPIVAITAFAMKIDEEKARSAGCTGFIAKPINTRTFARQVAGWLGSD
jgi:CheY-like chemotaxis protein